MRIVGKLGKNNYDRILKMNNNWLKIVGLTLGRLLKYGSLSCAVTDQPVWSSFISLFGD